MSKDYTTAPGVFHVVLKLKGDQKHVDFFHEILRRCDPSWPWKYGMFSRVQQCACCEGLCFSSPRINASDVKCAAKQAGVKVSISRFAPSEKCVSDSNRYQTTKWIEIATSHTLYRTKTWLETHAKKTPLVLLPGAATVPAYATVDTTGVINIGTTRPTTHTIYPDGTCECVCHDRPMSAEVGTRPIHKTGAGCCTKVWKPREHPIQPAIVAATAVVSANGEILDGEVDINTDDAVTIAAMYPAVSERKLMDQVLDAETEAATTPGGNLPWGGGYVN